jgi:hypothetical protein
VRCVHLGSPEMLGFFLGKHSFKGESHGEHTSSL